MKAEPTCSNEDPTTRRLPELTWTYWLGMLPNFTFHFPKSHKNPGVGGWIHTFRGGKRFFVGDLPLVVSSEFGSKSLLPGFADCGS